MTLYILVLGAWETILKLNSNCGLDELHLSLTAFPKALPRPNSFLSPWSEKTSATRTPKTVSMLHDNLKYLAFKRKPTVI